MLRRRPDIRSAELYAAAHAPGSASPRRISIRPCRSAASSAQHDERHPEPERRRLLLFPGAGLLYPLFNYGRIKNNVRVQDARYQQQLVGYRTRC